MYSNTLSWFQHSYGRSGAWLLAGPALLTAGVVLMLSPNAWTVAHLVFLSGTLAMLPLAAVLRDRLGDAKDSWLSRTGLALTVTGALCLAGQFVIDFAVMRLAGGLSATTSEMFNRIQDSVPMALVFYGGGPVLMFVGLALFGVVLVVRGDAPHLPGTGLVVAPFVVGMAQAIDVRELEVAGLALVLVSLAGVARTTGERSAGVASLVDPDERATIGRGR